MHVLTLGHSVQSEQDAVVCQWWGLFLCMRCLTTQQCILPSDEECYHNIPCNQTNCKSHFWNIKNGPMMPAQVCRDCSACSRGGIHSIYCMLPYTEHIIRLFREYPWRETSFKWQKREGTFSMEVVHQSQVQIHQNNQKTAARVLLLLHTQCCEDKAATSTL